MQFIAANEHMIPDGSLIEPVELPTGNYCLPDMVLIDPAYAVLRNTMQTKLTDLEIRELTTEEKTTIPFPNIQ